MLKTLLRVRLLTLVSWLTGASRKKKAQSKAQLIGFAALMVYAFGSIGFLFFHVFETIAPPFHDAGLDWLYFAIVTVMVFALMFVGSIFTAKAQLFEAKDNDLLLCLPLKPGDILLSRMFMLLVIAMAFGLLTAVPAGIVWGKLIGFTAAGLICFIVAFVLLVLLTLALCALFGWLISLLTAGARKKSLLTMVLSLICLGAYMYFCFNMNTLITELAAEPDATATAVGAVVPLYSFALIIAEGDFVGMLLAALLIAAIFTLMYLLLSATFMVTASGHRGGKKIKYVERRESAASPDAALFRRELGRFLSCPAYMMNSGMGVIMMVAGAVLLVIKRSAVQELVMQMPDIAAQLSPLAVVALCLMTTMTLITAPSVSLEGHSVWIAQSLPVGADAVLKAKLRLHNVMSIVPTILAGIAVAYVIKAQGFMLVSLFVLPCLYAAFIGVLGLTENLRHPNLDWTNETQAVKSGIGVLITMFLSWAILAVPAMIYAVAGFAFSIELLICCFALVIAVVYVILRCWLMRKGAKIFMGL